MTRQFVVPGPGTWEQDSTHCPRPITSFIFDAMRKSCTEGFSESTGRYGLLLSHLEPALVNNCFYHRMTMIDFSNQEVVGRRFQAAREALENKVWLKDFDRWEREVKPDSIRRNRELQAVQVKDLDLEGLISHLKAVRDNCEEMMYRHHQFTIAAIFATGLYLSKLGPWTGLDASALPAPLKGSSPVSLGAHQELKKVGVALNAADLAPGAFAGKSAAETLEALKHREDAVGEAVREYLNSIGLRLAGGYDVADPCAIEMPEMLLSTIWASREAADSAPDEDAAAARIRAAAPEEHRAQVDELLADARKTAPLRDERGIYNEAWSNGIARRALLEIGRRLAAAGRIDAAENALDATYDELVAMLRGVGGPSSKELRERTEWRENAPVSEIPPFLGPPPTPPPPMDDLPPHVAEAMAAVSAAIGEVFMPETRQSETAIAGKPVSSGVYTGTARVILHPSEFGRVTQGDVLVTTATSASFNVVLPLLGAIVTDRGGQLSHAAIVAREYGLPAVVGTLKATTVIPDGARVRVNGSTGRIDVL